MNRGARAALGASLLAIGLAGVLMLSTLSASADERSTEDSHAAMHEMMDAVHGRGTSDRMHRVEGAEQMMEQCSQMHAQMERMMDGGMMDGGMMDGGMNEMMPRS